MPTKSGAGFDKNPQNINRNGRPKKDQSMTKILNDVVSEESVLFQNNKITAKEALARKILEIAMKGDLPAMKYIYDRLDGLPTVSIKELTERPVLIDPVYSNMMKQAEVVKEEVNGKTSIEE